MFPKRAVSVYGGGLGRSTLGTPTGLAGSANMNTRPVECPRDAAPRNVVESSQEPAISISDLWMQYGQREVLRGMNLQVERGEILGLLGPNGAGKTTTIEILEGYRRRSAGEVVVLGQDPETATEQWRSRIGTVLQSWTDHRKWRVRDLLHNIGRHYRPYGTPDRPRPHDTDELLRTVGLADRANSQIGKLSGGQRRRLDVAVGMIGNPELLFLDEPTVGFDPEARYDFHQMIRRIAQVDHTTIVLTTHDLAEAETLADRIAILLDGTIAIEGTPGDLSAELLDATVIRYRRDGARHEVRTRKPVSAVRDIVCGSNGSAITGLEIRPSTLEDAYLTMMHEHASRQTSPQSSGLLR